ncbi:MAG: hypothetical protein OXF20_01950 [Gammaproteobacteria bacterium]|nr:hypothetical protein [Gammaproteobacteria bacterium]
MSAEEKTTGKRISEYLERNGVFVGSVIAALTAIAIVNNGLNSRLDNIFTSLDNQFLGYENRMDKKLSNIENRMDKKLSNIENRMDNRFSNIENKVYGELEKIKQSVGENSITLATVDEGMKHLQENFGIMSVEISGLKDNVSELKSEVSVLQSDVKSLKTSVSLLQSNVSQIEINTQPDQGSNNLTYRE